MPQKGNWTGLQEVHREKGGVQPGRVAKENGEEGGEGRGEATVVIGAGVSGQPTNKRRYVLKERLRV